MIDKKYTATVIGHYALGESAADGQTVKTRNIYDALEKKYSGQVNLCDTYKWRSRPLRFLLSCIKASKYSSNLILLPARNGVRIFIPLFYLLQLLHRTRLHYVVVGAWIVDLAKKTLILQYTLKRIEYIYAETNTLKNNLRNIGCKNVEILDNFKDIKTVNNSYIESIISPPFKLCTFSRVMKGKGIEDAISSVIQINRYYNKVVYTLDIYGKIDQFYCDDFSKIIENSPEYIKYAGVVEHSETTKVLQKYYLLLFPTHFYTEGTPGTIIDAYASGLPVISSRWESFADVIDEEISGIGYDMFNTDQLIDVLHRCMNPDIVKSMSKNCNSKALQYTPDLALTTLYFNIDK